MKMERVTDDAIASVFARTAEIIADALARDPAEVRLHSRLIADLGAESIDFLDIVFRLEQAFGVRVARGQILDEARGELSEEEFHSDGVLTAAGLARLRDVLDELPPESVRPGLRIDDVPLLFTVETFCKVVVRAQRSTGGAAG
jgi:acyl carrier protein